MGDPQKSSLFYDEGKIHRQKRPTMRYQSRNLLTSNPISRPSQLTGHVFESKTLKKSLVMIFKVHILNFP